MYTSEDINVSIVRRKLREGFGVKRKLREGLG